MASQPPTQALAQHLVSQTLASVALMESLQLINAADAAAIRQHLPNAYDTFPQLSAGPLLPPGGQHDPQHVWCAWRSCRVDAEPAIGGGGYQPPAPGGYQVQQTPVAAAAAPVRATPTLPARHGPGSNEVHARALWDYNGTEADDLHFRQGDVIVIDDEVNEQWYRGRVIPGGNRVPLEKGGLFPSNYVEKLAPGVAGAAGAAGATGAPGAHESRLVAPAYQPTDAGSASAYFQAPAAAYTITPPQHQQGNTTVVVQQGDDPNKKGKMGALGGKLGNAAVTGAGFGFGSAIASNIVNAIL